MTGGGEAVKGFLLKADNKNQNCIEGGQNTGPKMPVLGGGVNNTPKRKNISSELGNHDFYPVIKLKKPHFEADTVSSESPPKRIKHSNCSTGTRTFTEI